jgi:integrase
MRVNLREQDNGKGRKSLFLDFRVNKKRVREFLGLHLESGSTQEVKKLNRETLLLAENIRAKRQIELENGEHGFIPKFKRSANFVEYFLSLVPTKHRSWKTVSQHLTDYTKGSLSFSQLDERWLEEFRDFLIQKGISRNGTNTYMNKIKAALALAVRDRIIYENPAKRIAPLKSGSVKRSFLTLEELRLLSNTPCTHAEVKRAFLFACFTGLRLSDVKRLKWENVDGTTLTIEQKKTEVAFQTGLNSTALDLIGAPKSPGTSIFFLPSGDWTTWDCIQKWAKKAGLNKTISFHTSRRTFATLSLHSGSEIYTVMHLLGQKEIRNTQMYLELLNDKKQDAVNKLPKLEL